MMYAGRIYHDSLVNTKICIPFGFAALRLVVTGFRPLLLLFGPFGFIGSVLFFPFLPVFFVSVASSGSFPSFFAVSVNTSDHVHVLKLKWEHGKNMSKIHV